MVAMSSHSFTRSPDSCSTSPLRFVADTNSDAFPQLLNALYYVQTRKGLVWIRRQYDDPSRFQLLLDDEVDGSYHSPQAAAEDAAGGHTYLIPRGLVPAEVTEWTRGSAR